MGYGEYLYPNGPYISVQSGVLIAVARNSSSRIVIIIVNLFALVEGSKKVIIS